MARRLISFCLAASSAILVATCATALVDGPEAGAGRLTGRVWVLAQIASPAGATMIEPAGENAPSLEFNDDGTLAGRGGCNQFFGTYEVKEGRALALKDLSATCSPPSVPPLGAELRAQWGDERGVQRWTRGNSCSGLRRCFRRRRSDAAGLHLASAVKTSKGTTGVKFSAGIS